MRIIYLSIIVFSLCGLGASVQAQSCEGGYWCDSYCVVSTDVCCNDSYPCAQEQSCCDGGCCPDGYPICNGDGTCSSSFHGEDSVSLLPHKEAQKDKRL